MFGDELAMFGSGVARTRIGGVALNNGAVDALNHGTNEFGAQIVLIAVFTGVKFDGDFAR